MRILLSILLLLFLSTQSIAQGYKVDNIGNGFVRVIGPMEEGFADSVISAMNKENATHLIIMSSGGSMEESYKLNKFLKEKSVVIEGYCLSACAYSILSAKNISFGENAVLGFHNQFIPYVPSALTLNDFAKLVSLETLKLQNLLTSSGVTNENFYQTIIEQTDQTKFIIFSSNMELTQFKEGSVFPLKILKADIILSYLP